MAEDEESFVGDESDFVMPVEAPAVVDPAVGAFDHPPAWLDDEAGAGFWPGHDIDADAGLGRGIGNPLRRCNQPAVARLRPPPPVRQYLAHR